MPPPPHCRMSLIGKIGADEIFSMNISLSWQDEFPDAGWWDLLEPNNAVWNDLAEDAGNFWRDGRNRIHQDAQLRSVKFAFLGADGKYTKAPVERSLGLSMGNVEVGGSNGINGMNTGTRPPNSQSLACTLHTTADLGRIKGRVYLPIPVLSVASDGRISESDANDIEAGFKAFINNINNQPGVDVTNLRAVVASGGRHNTNGSVRVAPGLHDVTAVSVGRVPDVQRRRRNKLSEGRSVVSL